MKYSSVFEIIGPVMVGPSSSHTAGALVIGRLARKMFGRKPDQAMITLYGSFANTYHGHGTDIAIVGGILDLDTNDEKVIQSFELAQQMGINIQFELSEIQKRHPNTAQIELSDAHGKLVIVGISLGGGKVQIISVNGFELNLTGESPTLLVLHEDRAGMIAKVAGLLGNHNINIGHMEVSRKDRGSEALMAIETDQLVSEELMREIEDMTHILMVSGFTC
ncbi:L-serine dehydratase, iron-sulfur-dependent subunit beta [Desulfuribacillus stibiiarsenatis]|uniref:L-serine deaminase n=1 Tax=Desulfuribacillus stibiiarsenatis TaxID=1390249 RepID=A0A1E5L935_9FIRM|nr:L-serine ammonia-lyase, iron-sulfur-dependent subunit beta [Desulfuribacillus stibiiarsenatis]OEH86660.1 L-serine dehydratase, iron-sulfur-dependent subunit beta [Desulfuribacillus stibiiarsenatis]